MGSSPTARGFIYSLEFALAVFGAYLGLTFFEIWAYFPFWVKNAALAASLVAVYIFFKKTVQSARSRPGYKSPAEISLGSTPSYKVLHGLALISLSFAVWGGISAGAGLPGRLVQAFTFSLSQPPASILLTVTATPPGYLRTGPVTLFDESSGPVTRLSSQDIVTLPEGAILDITVTMEGTTAPTVSLGKQWARAEFVAENTYKTQLVVFDDATLDIQAGPYVAIQKRIAATPDENPVIAFSNTPEVTGRETLAIPMGFGDDHGVEDVYLEIFETGGERSDLFRIPLAQGFEEQTRQMTSYINFLDHPLAGSQVRATLTAVDGLGQKTTSEPILIRLPEKIFNNEIAVEVNSIRKALLVTPDRTSPQVNRLDRLTRDAPKFEGNLGVYLALRSAYWRLRSSETQKDLDEVTRFLWQTALELENDGSIEEQRVRSLLTEMTTDLAEQQDIRSYEKKADLLVKRLNALLRKEFQRPSRRVSLNTGVGSFEPPTLKSLRDLLETARLETREGNLNAALQSLLEANVLFEEMSY